MSMATDDVDRHSGWVTFAAVLLFAVGFMRIISAISYLANSHRINDFTNGVFTGHMWAWGLWDAVIAALALYAGYSLLNNGGFGRFIAYAWAIVVIVQSFLVIGIAPWYAAATIALAVFVIYGLSSTSTSRTA
jgi:energy-converting hydrogenase Eha subunit B